MINLFEYQNKEEFIGSFEDLEEFLDDIWKQREKSNYYDKNKTEEEEQRFLRFINKTRELKSNKYVGVIHFDGQKINLLPKIFFETEREYDEREINLMHCHILWWLSYCRRIKFPNYDTKPLTR